jgi:galactose-1-phosphate uridylyltransferase
LTKCLKLILSKLEESGLDYNFFLHNVVPDTNQHFYIKIQPRDSVWAGVELGSGLVINSISPEVAAKYYKKNAKKL